MMSISREGRSMLWCFDPSPVLLTRLHYYEDYGRLLLYTSSRLNTSIACTVDTSAAQSKFNASAGNNTGNTVCAQ